MAGGVVVVVVARSSLFTLLLFLHTCWSSGALVGFSYDARKQTSNTWSPREALSFLHKNKVPSSQFKVLLTNPGDFLDSLSNTNIGIDLVINSVQSKKLLTSKSSAISWIKTHLLKPLPFLNIKTIAVRGTKQGLPLLLPTLKLIRSALKTLDLDQKVNVSVMFSLPLLETPDVNLPRVMRFIEKSKSFIVLDIFVNRELSLGEGFVDSVLHKVLSAFSILPYHKVPLVLNVKSSLAPSGVEIANFAERMMKSIDSHAEIRDRISAVFVDVSPAAESEQQKLSWQEEVIFPTSHRELLDKMTRRDTVPPITIPSTNPLPDIVTIPSTTPITIPSTTPVSTPITVPATNPIPTPVTNPTTAPTTISPSVPVTNPVTTPTTAPVTNPVTTYPPPTSVTPPATIPGTVPVSPVTGSGQSWCVTRSGVTDAALQLALDYACGIGGADCSAIQPTGSCYNPNSLQAHASYAFNSYYQKNPVPTSCDFGGTATIVSTNPSIGTCSYPSSSSASGLSPASGSGLGTGSPTLNPAPVPPTLNPTPVPPTLNPTPAYNPGTVSPVFNPPSTTSSGPGSSVLNTNSSGGSSTVFGTDNPTGSTTSNSFALSGGWTLLILVLTACFTVNI